MSTPINNPPMPMSPIKTTDPTPNDKVITSPGGGTPRFSQKRSMAKRGRDSQSPEAVSRKKAKVDTTTRTPKTQPREKNNPKKPHKAPSCNTSFNASVEIPASQLDFSSQHDQNDEIIVSLETAESQDVELAGELSQPTVELETLGELDEDMTTPENVCSTGPEPSSDAAGEDDEEMTQPSDAPTATPDCTQPSLDTTQETTVDGRDPTVKVVNFAAESFEKVPEAAASAAQVAATADNTPAPAAAAPEEAKSSYCAVM